MLADHSAAKMGNSVKDNADLTNVSGGGPVASGRVKHFVTVS